MTRKELTSTLALGSIFAFRMLGLFMILPIFSVYAAHLPQATPTLIGFALGAYGLTQALFQLPFGIWSDFISRKKIFVAYNSLDTNRIITTIQRIKPSTEPKNPHRIVSMGRLIQSKKFDILLQAFRLVHEQIPGACLTIIGDGPEMDNLKKIASEQNIDQQVHFTGRILNDEDKARYLLSSSLFVLPGLGGLAINEAFCYNLPVICSTADGTEKQLVLDGINGLYCTPNDVMDMAQKIIHILSHPELQKQMSKNAYATVQEKFTLETMLNGFIKAMSSVATV
jgi:glycosyltransferase involved in cell wall biosynthesis